DRGGVEVAAVATELGEAQVVEHDDEHVGRPGRGPRRRREGGGRVPDRRADDCSLWCGRAHRPLPLRRTGPTLPRPDAPSARARAAPGRLAGEMPAAPAPGRISPPPPAWPARGT